MHQQVIDVDQHILNVMEHSFHQPLEAVGAGQ
jgi:hypothetical protein